MQRRLQVVMATAPAMAMVVTDQMVLRQLRPLQAYEDASTEKMMKEDVQLHRLQRK